MALPKITNKKKKADDGGDVKSKGPGGGLKAFVIMLIVMDLVAAGAYGYLTLVRAKTVTKSRTTARNNLLRVKRGGEEVYQALTQLKSARSEKVADPKTPILKSAQQMNIGQFLTVQNPTRKRFGGADNWDEWNVNVQFREKRGFKFKDLIAFCQSIESKNSKAQVMSLNFNKRDETEESHWRPTAMVVRVFKPRDTTR